MRYSTAIMVAALVAASSSAATAQSRVRVGVLECRGVSTSFVVGSVTDLRCVFRPSSGKAQRYAATVQKLGVDIGTASNIAVAWAVLAPTRQVGPGELAGTYGGVAANVTAGAGVGANVLLGGSNNTIALQPLSVQGQTGFGIAAGIAGLALRSTP